MIGFEVSEYRSENPQDRPYLSDALPEWHLEAECRGMDPDIFYPARGESTRKARAVCAGCAVKPQCLEWALAQNHVDDFGVWGGTSARERRALRARRRAA